MIKFENRFGVIEISGEYFAQLVGQAASNCFGVSSMLPSGPAQGIKQMAGAKLAGKGVAVRVKENTLEVDLHVEMTYGVNISTVVKSIVSEVGYAVEDATGIKVSKVNVFVDSMRCE